MNLIRYIATGQSTIAMFTGHENTPTRHRTIAHSLFAGDAVTAAAARGVAASAWRQHQYHGAAWAVCGHPARPWIACWELNPCV